MVKNCLLFLHKRFKAIIRLGFQGFYKVCFTYQFTSLLLMFIYCVKAFETRKIYPEK